MKAFKSILSAALVLGIMGAPVAASAHHWDHHHWHNHHHWHHHM